MPQKDNHDFHFPSFLRGFVLLLFERDGILLLDVYVGEVGEYAEHGDATDFLHDFSSFIEKTHVATKLIDDDTLYEFSFFFCEQHECAINGCENTASFNICNQYDRCLSILCHRHVHNIHISQVDFSNAASTLHHDGVVTL